MHSKQWSLSTDPGKKGGGEEGCGGVLYMPVDARVYQWLACRSVLGDRSFSRPWGGSVLDSVVGTFLTQNVSDQLSSKAYMTLAATFPPKPKPATTPTAPFLCKPSPATLAATFPPKPQPATTAAPSPPNPGSHAWAATSPPEPKAAAAITPSLHSSISPNASTEQASPATMQQSTGIALHTTAGPDCLISSPSYGDTPEGVAEGGTHPAARAEPTPQDAGVEGASSEVLSVCTLLGSTGSPQRGQSGVESWPEGAVIPSDQAAEGSDSIDWEAVRLAPRSKVEILATKHDNCCGGGGGRGEGEGNWGLHQLCTPPACMPTVHGYSMYG